MDNYQQLRVKIVKEQASYRINGETDKSCRWVKGIHVSMPHWEQHAGCALGLSIGQVKLFDEQHETKLLSCGEHVCPNDSFFRFDGKIEAGGNVIEGRLSLSPNSRLKEGDVVIIYLWLSDHETK